MVLLFCGKNGGSKPPPYTVEAAISRPHGIAFHISPSPLIYIDYGSKRGVVHLYTNIEQRACDLAVFIIENKATVRTAAKHFGISKSTVHKDLTERLPQLKPSLFRQVRELLDINKAERHIRGGLATKRKYKGEDE